MGIHAVAAWVYDLTPIESQTHMTGTLYNRRKTSPFNSIKLFMFVSSTDNHIKPEMKISTMHVCFYIDIYLIEKL
jgi:hypothetical protein